MTELPATDCLAAESLAALAEGILPEEEREAARRHLLACAECYEAFVDVLQVSSMAEQPPAAIEAPSSGPITRQNLGWIRMAAIAATVVLVAAAGIEWASRKTGAPDDLAELVAAVGELRPIEGRLSGGFTFGPLQSVTRSRASAAQPSAERRVAVAHLEESVKSSRTPRHLQTAGIAALTAGDSERATSLLEEAARTSPASASIWSDLSAAYLARAAMDSSPSELSRSLEAADKALAIEPALPEALYNRALVAEALSLSDKAAAWRKYLAVDSTSPWAGEARRHLQ